MSNDHLLGKTALRRSRPARAAAAAASSRLRRLPGTLWRGRPPPARRRIGRRTPARAIGVDAGERDARRAEHLWRSPRLGLPWRLQRRRAFPQTLPPGPESVLL